MCNGCININRNSEVKNKMSYFDDLSSKIGQNLIKMFCTNLSNIVLIGRSFHILITSCNARAKSRRQAISVESVFCNHSLYGTENSYLKFEHISCFINQIRILCFALMLPTISGSIPTEYM